ncbi:serine protease [Lentzea sp. NBRC 105346]|uniref:S1 family peptidase n=1 Tax=Lentzea sp. NBRC 105346 TaxID=3032205 RepID=UPI0024A59909|nr:serine protease [Lentzea sp. NBRC 105346]GLZ34423.1 serine protease [Lentzea sp. NBRC 105346]
MRRALLALALLLAFPAQAWAIYGGQEASQPYPFMASVQFKTGHWCGGTLIAPQWVMTAKHCLIYVPDEPYRQAQPSDVTVRVGSLDRSSGGELVGVTEFRVHGLPIQPKPTDGQEIRGTDIALLKLAHPVSVQPARIASSPGGPDVRLLGWGYNCQHPRGHGCAPIPERLRELDTVTLPREGCVSTKPGDSSIADKELCQAATARGETVRPHDSGSPMLIRCGSDWLVIGVASGPVQQGADAINGKGDGPNIYTDATAYRSWISSQIG